MIWAHMGSSEITYTGECLILMVLVVGNCDVIVIVLDSVYGSVVIYFWKQSVCWIIVDKYV